LSLNNLEDVAVLGSPSDGQLLVFDASVGLWRNLHRATLDFISLTDENPAVDTSFTIYRHPGPDSGVGAFLNIADLTSTRFFRFPNTDGTFALQNQFTVTQALTPTPVAAPVGTRVDAFASCASGKAIGVGIASSLPVQVEDMLLIDADTVRITVRGIDANTTVQAIAFCMTMP
jgi:hypothetical protein